MGKSLAIATQIADARSSDFLTGGGRDKTRAFRAAMRHSRFVRFVRLALPVLLLASAGGYWTYRWLDPMRALARLPIGADGVVLSGTKIIMQQPRLTGFTKDERPYTLVARTAAKDLTDPDKLEMKDVHATMVMPDRRMADVTAEDGFYDAKANTVRLRNNVVVTTPEYKVLLEDALLHTKAGHVVSELPVVVNMLQGTINANRLEISELGAIIKFERGVVMLIDRESAPQLATGSIVP